MKKLMVQVTQEDILLGIKKNAFKCPIACAVKRAFPNWQEVEVCDDGIKVLDDMNTYWDSNDAANQDTLIGFMKAFDEGEPVRPFTIEVTFEEREREPRDWEY